MQRLPIRGIAEIVGVCLLAVGAGLVHVGLAPLVLGVYLVAWANVRG